jgi:thiol:disulfide interchange protein DsbD
MKKITILLVMYFTAVAGYAQLNPVTWTFTATKVSDKTYEVHMKAIMQSGWHIYSQTQPEDAIVIPTSFIINPNPLFIKDGNIKESGKMQKVNDEVSGSAHQYSGSVDFVQKIKLKSNARTNFSGTVEYQTCNDQKCLPPKKVNFTVAIK